jgi:hypothetical protein
MLLKFGGVSARGKKRTLAIHPRFPPKWGIAALAPLSAIKYRGCARRRMITTIRKGVSSAALSACRLWFQLFALLLSSVMQFYVAETIFNPTIPATINPTQTNLAASADSPKKAIPRKNVPTAPMPVHTA